MTVREPLIRQPAVAGTFYPHAKEDIEKTINEFLGKVPDIDLPGKLKALIVPHAGLSYSGQTAAFAYKLLQKHFAGKQNSKPRIILLGPSHYLYVEDAVTDVHEYWLTPLGKVKIAESNFPKAIQAHKQEHCLEVQLPFLQKVLNGFEVLPLVTGDAEPKEISKKIQPLLDENTILIASSDLSHSHAYAEAVKLDNLSNQAIESLDYEKMMNEGEACGKVPILAAIGLAKSLGWKAKLLDYRNSGDVVGDKSGVVGYASFAFYK